MDMIGRIFARVAALCLCAVLCLGASVPVMGFAGLEAGFAHAEQSIDAGKFIDDMSGKTDGRSDAGSWNEDMIKTYMDDGIKDKSGDDLPSIAAGILGKVLPWLLFCLVLFMGVRMAGRGIIEMVGRQNSKEIGFDVPFIFKTNSERSSGIKQNEWVLPMLKENFIYGGLTFFVFVILGILISLVFFVLTNIAPSA